LPNFVRIGSKVLLVGRNLLGNGRGRWLALAASLLAAGYKEYLEAKTIGMPDTAAP
jgi:hypothetical protein